MRATTTTSAAAAARCTWPFTFTEHIRARGEWIQAKGLFHQQGRPVKAAPKLQDRLVSRIKAMIGENPSFGYRTVAHLLGFNKNTVQRIF